MSDAGVERLMGLSDIITPYAVRAAATLRLADRIAAGTRTVEALARETGTDLDALARLLRYLACRGVLRQEPDGGLALTDVGEPLLEDHALGLRAWLDLDGVSGRMDAAVPGLLETVRTGEPAYVRVHGAPLWEDPAAREFDALMEAHAASFAPEVVASRDWSGCRHVVDIGGGTGTFLAEVLRAAPHARGTLVDLPETAAAAETTLAAAGLDGRVTVLAGSFFEALPAGGDTYLLVQILHDWPDSLAVAILRRCAEAAGEHGRVVIVERPLDGGSREEMTGMDLRMLLVFGSRERTKAELSALAAAAGLRVVDATRTDGGFVTLDCARA